MKTKLFFLIPFLSVVLFLSGCGDAQPATQAPTVAVADKPGTTRCFRNEYPFQDAPDKMDVEELTFTTVGDQVTGDYNWLPAEKDQRKGSFTGTIDGKMITAVYSYSQEGRQMTSPLRISLRSNEVTVEGDEPELGFDATIEEVNCGR